MFRPYDEDTFVSILNKESAELHPLLEIRHSEIAKLSKGYVRMAWTSCCPIQGKQKNNGERKVLEDHIKFVSKTSRKYRFSYMLKKLN